MPRQLVEADEEELFDAENYADFLDEMSDFGFEDEEEDEDDG